MVDKKAAGGADMERFSSGVVTKALEWSKVFKNFDLEGLFDSDIKKKGWKYVQK